METKCTGGARTLLEVRQGGDCNTCVGFAKFVENGNGTITITLTNGQSFTYRVSGSPGAPGPKGDKGDTGTGVLINQFPNLATIGAGSFESLMKDRVPVSISGGTLNVDGDELKGFAWFTGTPNPVAPYQVVNIYFAGQMLIGFFDYPGFYSSSHFGIKLHFRIIRLTNATLAYHFDVEYYSGGFFFTKQLLVSNSIDVVTIGGLNLSATAYDFNVMARSKSAGDITCKAIELFYIKR